MYIQSIISCRDGFERLKQRPSRWTRLGLGDRQGEHWDDINSAINSLEVSHTRIDETEFTDRFTKLRRSGGFESSGRVVINPEGSAVSYMAGLGAVHLEWTSHTPLADGQLDQLSNAVSYVPIPPGLPSMISMAWRDLFPGWEDSSSRGANIGLVKDGVALNLIVGRTMIDSWLFQRVPLAVRKETIDLAVGVFIQGGRDNKRYLSRALRGMSAGFSRIEANLKQLQPINLEMPFVLICLSPDPVSAPKFLELQALAPAAVESHIIERVIEVPAQYQQAVLGILGYFGTYLQRIAPEVAKAATIRIEQGAGFLRLVVDGENGSRHVLERAFEDYQSAVAGEMPVESLGLTPLALAELKNELRFAEARIEMQKEILSAQGLELKSLRELSLSLAKRSPSDINVQVTSTANASSSVEFDVRSIVDAVSTLAAALNREDGTEKVADELEQLATEIEGAGEERLALKRPMERLRQLLDDACAGGSRVHSALEKTVGAVELAQKLARRYNALAEWLGLPQVPRAIAGRGE